MTHRQTDAARNIFKYLQNLKSDKLSNKAKFCGGEDLSKSLEETKTVNSSLIIG